MPQPTMYRARPAAALEEKQLPRQETAEEVSAATMHSPVLFGEYNATAMWAFAGERGIAATYKRGYRRRNKT